MLVRKPDARTFGQDLMRGEHVVGGGGGMNTAPGLTRVGGNRPAEALDETSRKILAAASSGTSIFDPVLCELAYRWFCPAGGVVLDPFAGGSVRGIVASKLGRSYVGADLRAEQVEANRVQAAAICGDPLPAWHVADSREINWADACPAADFIFSCPPYADLERYSDDPADLSTMAYDDFIAAYRVIIARAAAMLRPDRFAAFVVGDVRDRRGFYRAFPWHTVEAFEAAGCKLYNEGVLVTAVGSLPIRVGKQFAAARKLGKTHQNILVFCKGDPRKATSACGAVDFASPPDVAALLEAAMLDLGGAVDDTVNVPAAWVLELLDYVRALEAERADTTPGDMPL